MREPQQWPPHALPTPASCLWNVLTKIKAPTPMSRALCAAWRRVVRSPQAALHTLWIAQPNASNALTWTLAHLSPSSSTTSSDFIPVICHIIIQFLSWMRINIMCRKQPAQTELGNCCSVRVECWFKILGLHQIVKEQGTWLEMVWINEQCYLPFPHHLAAQSQALLHLDHSLAVCLSPAL